MAQLLTAAAQVCFTAWIYLLKHPDSFYSAKVHGKNKFLF